MRAAGAVSLIDGAQAVPQMAVDVQEIGADFYAWTGHKALGPTGIGVLHGRRAVLEEMEPFLTGGDMIASVDFQSATWNELPFKFEAGTPPIAEAVGLGVAVEYLSKLGMDRVRAHERGLTEYLLERLAEVPGLRIVGPPEAERRGGLVSFTIEGIHPHDVAELADRGGVCIRAGHHCAQPLMRFLGMSSTARASVGVYNDSRDIDALVDALIAGRRGVRAVTMDDLYRDYILDHYKHPRNFGELRAPRPRGARAQPAVRGRAGGAHPREGRPHRRAALPRPRLRDLPGIRLDRIRGAEGHGARGGRQAGRRLDDRAARDPGLGDPAQVRPVEPEGRARRGHRRRAWPA